MFWNNSEFSPSSVYCKWSFKIPKFATSGNKGISELNCILSQNILGLLQEKTWKEAFLYKIYRGCIYICIWQYHAQSCCRNKRILTCTDITGFNTCVEYIFLQASKLLEYSPPKKHSRRNNTFLSLVLSSAFFFFFFSPGSTLVNRLQHMLFWEFQIKKKSSSRCLLKLKLPEWLKKKKKETAHHF